MSFSVLVEAQRFLAQYFTHMLRQRDCRWVGRFAQLFEKDDEGLRLTGEILDDWKDEPNFQFTCRKPVGQRTNQILFVFHAEAKRP